MQEEPGDCHQPHNPARTGSEPTENTTGESKVNRPVFPVYHFLVSRKISARHFAGIFQWMTGICTENIPPFNPLTDEDN